ncbi:MAG: CBS domain-containing protein [Planctomycetes bacterium]|nr:CBS domain-containing protein [Planctomycetota bacterium]
MKVKDVMSAEVRTCSPNDDLGRAAQIMWEGDCGIVPVVEPDDYLVGVVTDRDACMAAYTQGRTLAAVRTGDVMSRQLRTLRPEEDAEAAGAAMGKLRVRRLPVVDGLGRLVGLVSLADLARGIAREKHPAARRALESCVLDALCQVSLPWEAQGIPAAAQPSEARQPGGAGKRQAPEPAR